MLFGAGDFGKVWLEKIVEFSKTYKLDFRVVGKRKREFSKTYKNLCSLGRPYSEKYLTYKEFQQKASGKLWIIVTPPYSLFEIWEYANENYKSHGIPKLVIVEKPFIINYEQYQKFKNSKLPTIVNYIELFSSIFNVFLNETLKRIKEESITIIEKRYGKFIDKYKIGIIGDWGPHAFSKLSIFSCFLGSKPTLSFLNKKENTLYIEYNLENLLWRIIFKNTKSKKRTIEVKGMSYKGIFDFLKDQFYLKEIGIEKSKFSKHAEDKIKKLLKNIIQNRKPPFEITKKIIEKEVNLRLKVKEIVNNL